MRAISLFCGAGGMDIGFQAAGINVVWANEIDANAVQTYRHNHPNTLLFDGDIRLAKSELSAYHGQGIDMVFGGPPCQGFSVAGKMDPNDDRSKMIWEFFDVVELVKPRIFVLENVKALAQLVRWENVRTDILTRASTLGYHCFFQVLNAADFGVPQKRERVFFVGFKKDCFDVAVEQQFKQAINSRRIPRVTLRECLNLVGTAGSVENPLTCTAKITLASRPVLRKSPYAGMLFNGMGRPLNLDAQANTLPASMGGNKTPIVDDLLLCDPNAKNWIVDYHSELLLNTSSLPQLKVPSHLRRLTIKEAAAIQTFPSDYVFCGEKSSIYRQIGNAVPCKLAKCVAESIISLSQ